MTHYDKINANKRGLEQVMNQIHQLKQNILPPSLEAQGLEIFGTREKAIAGLLKAKTADKEAFEHIIRTLEAEDA